MITVDFLAKQLLTDANIQLVDVRPPSAFDAARIAGSLNVPLRSICPDQDKLNLSQPMYLICTDGSLAELAAARLKRFGYQHVCVVAGGLRAWVIFGHPLEGRALSPSC